MSCGGLAGPSSRPIGTSNGRCSVTTLVVFRTEFVILGCFTARRTPLASPDSMNATIASYDWAYSSQDAFSRPNKSAQPPQLGTSGTCGTWQAVHTNDERTWNTAIVQAARVYAVNP